MLHNVTYTYTQHYTATAKPIGGRNKKLCKNIRLSVCTSGRWNPYSQSYGVTFKIRVMGYGCAFGLSPPG